MVLDHAIVELFCGLEHWTYPYIPLYGGIYIYLPIYETEALCRTKRRPGLPGAARYQYTDARRIWQLT